LVEGFVADGDDFEISGPPNQSELDLIVSSIWGDISFYYRIRQWNAERWDFHRYYHTAGKL